MKNVGAILIARISKKLLKNNLIEVIYMKKFLLIISLVILSIVAILIGQGYRMYKDAIDEIPLVEKIEEIGRASCRERV